MDSKKVICTNKQIQIYEILNKIQNVINTESLLPQFIYFAKNMEEIRKKWLQAEMKCKELEKNFNLEKSILQRKINELKIDMETHHEKRLQAENKSERLQTELDKLQRQFEMFKEVLTGNGADKKSLNQNYDDRFNALSAYNINDYQTTYGSSTNNPQLTHHNSHAHHNHHNHHQNHHQYNDNDVNTSRRLTIGGIEDTGSIISDYTEDDIDLPNDDNHMELCNHHHNNVDIRKIETSKQQMIIATAAEQVASSQGNKINGLVSSSSLQPRATRRDERSSERQSVGRKRNQRHSASLTRAGERRDKKRSRTRSTDLTKAGKDQENIAPTKAQEKEKSSKQSSRGSNGIATKAITAITTLKIDEDGRPITVTSEIKHNNSENLKQQHTQINPNSNKMELSFLPQRTTKTGRKKRPSREFLQRSADESISTEDSEIFWNGEANIEDVANTNQSNVHIMTPIVEAATPGPSSTYQNRVYSNFKKSQATPLSSKLGNQKSLSANSIPLSKKYKRAHMFKGQVILNSELCAHCDKRTKFGKMIMKCRECDMVVHNECKDLLQRPCYPVFNFPAQGTISDYVVGEESPHIPPILQMIINEIETRGLLTHEVGLYRVNGSDAQIKQLKERLIKRHQLPDLRKVNDVHVLCSFVKDFLSNLSERLITYDSWYRFAKACEIQNESERMLVLQEAIQDLPEANRDTLSFMMLHLQRINETPECKMPASNLARMFGPSIVGNSSEKPQPAEIIKELNIQQQIIENLIRIQTNFYMTFVDGIDSQQRLFKNSTKTPEIMRKSKTATVLSSILGPATNLPSKY